MKIFLTIPIPRPNHKNARGIPMPRKILSVATKSFQLYKLRRNDEILKYINKPNIIH